MGWAPFNHNPNTQIASRTHKDKANTKAKQRNKFDVACNKQRSTYRDIGLVSF